MPRHPTGHRKYDIGYLWDSHHEILRWLACGVRPKVVAQLVGCTPQTVSNVQRSPLGQQRLSELRETRDEATADIRKELQEICPAAVATLKEFVENQDGNIPRGQQLDAAKTVLGINGYSQKTQIEVEETHKLDPDTIRVIRETAEAKRQVYQQKEMEAIVEAELIEAEVEDGR